MKKIWTVKSKLKVKSSESEQPVKIEEIIQLLLNNRGLKTKKEIEEFLTPTDPYLLSSKVINISKNELTKTIKRIEKAIQAKELIIIYGDYDTDGISATAILWETLHHLKAKVLPFIPQREEHGYGINQEGIKSLLQKYPEKPKLIITVDNGIVAFDGIEFANKNGIEVIITDHHQKKVKSQKSKVKSFIFPKAYAIIWSEQVSGAGLAWFLAKEIYHHFHQDLKGFKASNSLELAAIGTVTDMMPMLGVNRSLVRFGINELRQSQRPGIRALCTDAGVLQQNLDVYHLGFIIGPRLNAMGRLEEAVESLRLLCTRDHFKAQDLARKLGTTNRQRQDLTQATLEHAKTKAKLKAQKSKIIIVSHESYNQGVIGLVAGKLVEEYYRPTIVISQGKKFSKGSVRSVNGFNIIEFLRKGNFGFVDLGGHPMAAGFTIETSKIKKLAQLLTKKADKELKTDLLQPTVNIDLELKLEDASFALEKAISDFAPFGLANPRPVFLSRKAKVVTLRPVGRTSQHLKLQLQPNLPSTFHHLSSNYSAIAFNLGKLAKKLKPGDLIDIVYNLETNTWNGDKRLEIKIKDIKIC